MPLWHHVSGTLCHGPCSLFMATLNVGTFRTMLIWKVQWLWFQIAVKVGNQDFGKALLFSCSPVNFIHQPSCWQRNTQMQNDCQSKEGLFHFAANSVSSANSKCKSLSWALGVRKKKRHNFLINKHVEKKHRQNMHYLYIGFLKKKWGQQEQILHPGACWHNEGRFSDWFGYRSLLCVLM